MSVIKMCGQTLSEVLSAAKPYDTIILEGKVYREKVVITTPHLTILGSDDKKSAIVFDDYANKIAADGLEYNTFRTYTVNVLADNVTMKNLAVVNDALYPSIKGQAVALSVYGDLFYGEDLTLSSLQDTLFCGPLPDDLITRYMGFLPDAERYYEGESRQIFKNCVVYGSVDYVFGTGTAFFDQCRFVCCNDDRREGYVAAPAHSLKQKIGFVFYKCEFCCEKNVTADLFLARPWRDYGKASFISCDIPSRFNSALFDKWNSSNRDKTARFELDSDALLKTAAPWVKAIDKQAEDFYLNALKDIYKLI